MEYVFDCELIDPALIRVYSTLDGHPFRGEIHYIFKVLEILRSWEHAQNKSYPNLDINHILLFIDLLNDQS